MTNNKDFRWKNAQWCIKCDLLTPEKQGGIRAQVCGKCVKKIRAQIKTWEKHGLYATKAGLKP